MAQCEHVLYSRNGKMHCGIVVGRLEVKCGGDALKCPTILQAYGGD